MSVGEGTWLGSWEGSAVTFSCRCPQGGEQAGNRSLFLNDSGLFLERSPVTGYQWPQAPSQGTTGQLKRFRVLGRHGGK